MSLILEALRKSEAERQRGSAPGLFVEQRLARSRDKRVPAWAWALVAVLVVVVLAWGWREWHRAAEGGVTTGERVATAVTEARPTQIAAGIEAAPGEAGSLAPIALAPGPAAAPSAPAPAAARADPPPAAPALPVAVAQAANLPSRPEAIQARAPEPAPIAPAPPEPLAYVPGIDVLPASERAALPPLKLSMHVYADAPAKRFVILDGRRLGEGASPAAGVVLEEIRRDGLVLSVNGQRLLLARP